MSGKGGKRGAAAAAAGSLGDQAADQMIGAPTVSPDGSSILAGRSAYSTGDGMLGLNQQERERLNALPGTTKATIQKMRLMSQAHIAKQAAQQVLDVLEYKNAGKTMQTIRDEMERSSFDGLEPEAKFARLEAGFAAATMVIGGQQQEIRQLQNDAVCVQRRVRYLESEIADAKRCYTKYGIKIIGKLPAHKKGEDPTTIALEAIKKKYGLELCRGEIKACHRLGDIAMAGRKQQQMVIMFGSNIMGSSYDKLTWRPNNWAGELGNKSLELEVSRLTARGFDARTKSALLWVRRCDKDKQLEERRVRRVDTGRDAVPSYTTGRNERRRCFHPDEALALMDDAERQAWTAMDERKGKADNNSFQPGATPMDTDLAEQILHASKNN